MRPAGLPFGALMRFVGVVALLCPVLAGLSLRPASATPSDMLTIAVIGDYGCQPSSSCPTVRTSNENAVAALVHSWKPDAILTVGDNSYESGTAADVAADQRPYAADIAAGRFYATPGNHDWLNGSIQPSTAYFQRPPHYVAHLGAGLLDIFVTDMNAQDPDGDSTNSRQAAQYRADVAASTATWKVTADHQAFYSSGEHGSNAYTHWAILPQIDLFLSGHDHDFEHLVEGGKPFVVDGVGGRNLYAVCKQGCIPGSVWHDDRDWGAVRLTVTPTQLTVDFVNVQGQVLHSFSLTRSAAASGTVAAPPSPVAPLTGRNEYFPIRAAFYYPWFPEAWTQQGMHPFTHYHPEAGLYDGSNSSLIKKQIAEMEYGHIQAGIASWWGIGTPTDKRFPELLKAATGTSFRWAALYEPEGIEDPTPSQIVADLSYIRTQYADQPGYMRVGGRFVVFVFAEAKDACDMTGRWSQAHDLDAYVVLKIFPGYRTCEDQPDSWYQYAPDHSTSQAPGYSYTISPGFYKATESRPRLGRDPARWDADIRAMEQSHAPFQLITSFNEWGEGTSIEPAKEWASVNQGVYLDGLHRDGVAAPVASRGFVMPNYVAPVLAVLGIAGVLAVLFAVPGVRRRITRLR